MRILKKCGHLPIKMEMANYPTKNLRQSHSFHKAENNYYLIVLHRWWSTLRSRPPRPSRTSRTSAWRRRCSARTILYCSVLYCDVMYCNVLYCTLVHCTVLYRRCSALPPPRRRPPTSPLRCWRPPSRRCTPPRGPSTPPTPTTAGRPPAPSRLTSQTATAVRSLMCEVLNIDAQYIPI